MATETYRVRDRTLGLIQVTGEILGRIDTRQGSPEQHLARRRPRWGVNTVFKIASGQYVLVTEAFSVMYHTPDTRCTIGNGQPSGSECQVLEMAAELEHMGLRLRDAISCDVCQPDWPEDLRADETVRFEFPRRQVSQCESGSQVRGQLVTSRRYSGVRSTKVPEPVRALLALCVAADPDFYASDEPAIKIG